MSLLRSPEDCCILDSNKEKTAITVGVGVCIERLGVVCQKRENAMFLSVEYVGCDVNKSYSHENHIFKSNL